MHANSLSGSDNTPNVVTALVKHGPLTASGKAFEASSTLTTDTGHYTGTQFVGNGSNGGTIRLEASGTVTLANCTMSGNSAVAPSLGTCRCR